MSLIQCCVRCGNPIKDILVLCPKCGYQHIRTEAQKQLIRRMVK